MIQDVIDNYMFMVVCNLNGMFVCGLGCVKGFKNCLICELVEKFYEFVFVVWVVFINNLVVGEQRVVEFVLNCLFLVGCVLEVDVMFDGICDYLEYGDFLMDEVCVIVFVFEKFELFEKIFVFEQCVEQFIVLLQGGVI